MRVVWAALGCLVTLSGMLGAAFQLGRKYEAYIALKAEHSQTVEYLKQLPSIQSKYDKILDSLGKDNGDPVPDVISSVIDKLP